MQGGEVKTCAMVKQSTSGWTKINVTPAWAKEGLPPGARIVRCFPASGNESWRGEFEGYTGVPKTHTQTGYFIVWGIK